MNGELSRLRTASALRRFIFLAVLWAICDNIIFPSGPVFSRLILTLGGRMEHIGYLTSLVALAGLALLASARSTPKVLRSSRNILLFGLVSTVAIALLPAPLFLKGHCTLPFATAFAMLSAFMLAAYVVGNFLTPTLTQWLAQVIPEETRARYVSFRTAIYNVAAVATLTVAGLLLDATVGREHIAFYVLFGTATIACLSGYLVLYRTPRPAITQEDTQSVDGRSEKFSREFLTFLLFYSFWFFGLMFASPFFNAYMLGSLKLSNRAVAMIANIGIASSMVGTLLAGFAIDKFGSRGLIQMMIPPLAVSRIMWVLITPQNALWLIPVMWLMGGMAFGIIFTSAYSLLFKLTPSKSARGAKYFAFFWVASAAANIAGPACGGFVLGRLHDGGFTVFSRTLDASQIIFLVSGILLTLSLGATLLIKEKAAGPHLILGHIIRGNILRFAYNYAVFHATRDSRKRAKAVRGAARSKSPAAAGLLRKALSDADKAVRSEAVRGLGHARDAEAEDALIYTLDDYESDVRAEAAEALGHIRSSRATERLAAALYDEDLRVRLSAVSALAGIGTQQALEVLRGKLEEPLDRGVFPSLVDALTRKGELAAATAAIRHMGEFPSYSVRMQLASAVCRALGDRGAFYSLLGKGRLARTRAAHTMLTAGGHVIRSLYGTKSEQHAIVSRMVRSFENEDFRSFVHELALFAVKVLPEAPKISAPQCNRVRAAAEVIAAYVGKMVRDEVTDEDWMFTLTVFSCLVRALGSAKRNNSK